MKKTDYTPVCEESWAKGLELYDWAKKRTDPLFAAAKALPKLPEGKRQAAFEKIKIARDELKIETCIRKASPKQLEALGAFFSAKHCIISLCGANRSGKSFAAAMIYALYLRDHAEANTNHLCVTTNWQLSAKNQQKMLWDLLPKRMFGQWQWKNPHAGFGTKNPLCILDERGPSNPDGRNLVVNFMTQTQFEDDFNAFEGITAETFFADETLSEECFSALRTRVALSEDGRGLVSTIPNAAYLWDIIYNAEKNSGIWFHKFLPQDNPLMTTAKLADWMKTIPEHERMMRVDGDPMMVGTIVFNEFTRDRHVVKRSDIPDDLCYYAGMDVGMDHPTVWLLIGVTRDGKYYVVDEYTSRNTPPQDDAPAILGLLGKRKLASPTYGDPAMWQVTKANNRSVARQYADCGLTIRPSARTSKVGENNQVYQIKSMLRNDELLVCEDCHKLIRELSVWKYKRDQRGRPLGKDAYEDKDNDAIDSMRYCLTMMPTYRDPNDKVQLIYV